MKYFDELLLSNLITQLINRGFRSAKATISVSEGAILYVVARSIRPEIVLEAGVGAGASTAFLLQALHDNNFGILISIDMPSKEILGSFEVSYLVPPHLRSRWRLLMGRTEDILPQLLSKYELNIAFLDDDASYHHRMFEYTLIWPRLRSGGCVISDNVDLSPAYTDFLRKVRASSLLINDKFGIIVKSE